MAIGKNAFWHSLLFTIFIFASGLFIGFLVENARVTSVESAIYNSEINLLDQQVRPEVIDNFGVSCDVAKQELFSFADRIYDEAVNLEQYDSSSKFADTLPILHKRYDLLRVMLWTESRQLDSKCDGSFHRVVYLYEFSPADAGKVGVQAFYARLLADTKDKFGDRMLLIPIAVNTDVSSVDVLMDEFGIKDTPTIIIDEKVILSEPPTAEELDAYMWQNNN